MTKIAIVGAAGGIGSATAFNITVHKLAREVVLIDNPQPDMVAIHALDLNTAASGLDVKVRAGTSEDLSGADLVIITAGSSRVVSSRLEVLPQNLPIIKSIAQDIKRFCPEAVVITATNPVCPLTYAMYLCLGDRKKLIGYSYNDTIRFRLRLAHALGVKARQVECAVIGEHGDSQVMLFSSVRVKGETVAISEEVKQKIRLLLPKGQQVLGELLAKTGRTAAWTTAVGIATLVRAITKNTGETIPCSAALDGEYGCHNMSMGVPAVLGRESIQQILEWKLADDEKKALEQSIEILKPAMRYVEEHLDKC
jgi:malate dehydrogenase